MLAIQCEENGHTRRDVLRLGSLGLGGLALPQLLASRAHAESSPDPLTGKSVIFLFQQGGPSQLETFDPKPDAPEGVRTVGDTIPTSLPGVRFGEALPQLAKLAHKFTVVRSFHTSNAGHNIQPIVGSASKDASIGAHFARVAGTTRPDSGMPTSAVLFNHAVDADVTEGKARGDLSSTGPYGKAFTPFVPGAGGQLQADMKVKIARERLFEDRQSLLTGLDRLQRTADADGSLDAMNAAQQQAYQVLLGGGVSRALDLTQEDPKIVARYDTSQYARGGEQWNKVSRGKAGYYTGQARTLGKQLLTARRLCDAGCGFVTVHAGYAGVWDMHADKNNLGVADGMKAVGHAFDHAVAAFIEDLEASGLSEKILLVCTGEMGRTPKINSRGGRDHWSRLAPLMLYGGGYEGGRVIGESDAQGGEPASEGYGPVALISTILHTQIDAGKLRLLPDAPPEVKALMEPGVIPLG